MFCPKCGAKQEEDSRFCSNCGADLSEFLDLDVAAEGSGEVDASGAYEGTKPVSDSSNNMPNAAYVKPKKKRAVKGVAALALIALIAAGAYYVVTNFILKDSSQEKYVFLSDGTYYLSTNLKKDKEIELAQARTDDAYELDEYAVRFSSDGKYVYYFTKIEEGYGTLCRAEVDKLKRNSSKNEKYNEIIASNVSTYIRLLKNGCVVFKNAQDTLFCYDGKESVPIAKNVMTFDTDKDSKVIYQVMKNDDEDEYRTILYGVDVNDIKNPKKMATNVEVIIDCEDFNHIYISEENEDGDDYIRSLYVAEFGKEAVKIADKVGLYDLTEAGLYYTAYNGTKLNLYDYVKDNGDDDYYYEMLRDEIKEEYPFEVDNLYLYKNGKSALIAENIVGADLDYYMGEDAIVYKTLDMVTEKVSIEDIEEAYEVSHVFDIDYAKANYIFTDDPGSIITMSDNAAAKLGISDESGRVSGYHIGSHYYLETNEEVYDATIKEKQISDVSLVGDGYVIGHDENNLYVMTNENDENDYADVNIITEGESKEFAIGVEVYSGLKLYKDGVLLGYTSYDMDSDEGSGDLAMFDPKGNMKTVGNDVSSFVRKDEKSTLFISNGGLYEFNGKDEKQLKDFVDKIWCSKEMKDEDVFEFMY